jgi:hypothetical protein
MSVSAYHCPPCPNGPPSRNGRPVASRPSGSCGCPQRLRSLVRRIAHDDRAAFVELFDDCSALVLSDLRARVPDPDRVTAVLAGTFVEVWWLAGCHVSPDMDVITWLDRIVERRIVDSRPAPAELRSGPPWTRGNEVELAGLLGRPGATGSW